MAETSSSTSNGTILVTGGAGFIGSHFVRLFRARHPQRRIIVLDGMSYASSRRNLFEGEGEGREPSDGDKGLLRLVEGDVRDARLVASLLEEEEEGIDAVLHFAAQTHVDSSFAEGGGESFASNNIHGTHVLLEACRAKMKTDRPIRRFVFVSTDEVYGDTSADLPAPPSSDDAAAAAGLSESSLLDPTNPYSATKAAAEMLCRAYAHGFGVPVIITRGNNVYGPAQHPEKLVPRFILQAARGIPLTVHGDGTHRRSYMYVEDAARAFEAVLLRGIPGEVYNIGTRVERTVLDVARDVLRLVRKGGRLSFVGDRAFNDRRYFIDASKLAGLGWRESTPWEEGLRKTVAWYTAEDRERCWWGA